MSTENPAVPAKGPTKLWLPVVITIGVLVGATLAYFIPAPFGCYAFGGCERFQGVLILHTILSTVSIALLVALIVIYVRVYAATGARFSLGITVVLFALMLQALIQYPPFLVGYGPFGEGQAPFLSSADVFTIVAYTIFLYLSLE
jgi:hypothetical protein